MFDNLKKIESSIEELAGLEVKNELANKMISTLIKERKGIYAKKEIFLALLKKDKAIKGLSKPKALSKMKMMSSDSPAFSSARFSTMLSIFQDINDEFELEEISYFYGKELMARIPQMKSIIIKRILESLEFRSELLLNKKVDIPYQTIYKDFNFTFDMEMLNENEKETLIDILENYDAYKIHPSIGIKVMRKELDKLLEEHYNNYLFYLKDENEQMVEFIFK